MICDLCKETSNGNNYCKNYYNNGETEGIYASLLRLSKEMKKEETINFMLDYLPGIKKIIYNEPATILVFKNGGKSIVKCQDDNEHDLEKAILFAYVKHAKKECKRREKQKIELRKDLGRLQIKTKAVLPNTNSYTYDIMHGIR